MKTKTVLTRHVPLMTVIVAALLLCSGAVYAALIVDCTFETVDPTPWTSSYVQGGGLGNAGHYEVRSDSFWNPTFPPYEGSKMMVLNGATVQNTVLWSVPVSVTSGDYGFSAWVASATDGSPAVLQFRVNGTPIGSTFTAGAVGAWGEFVVPWHSPGDQTVTLALVDTNTALSYNDFTLDKITFSGPAPVPIPGAVWLLGSGLLGLLGLKRKIVG